MQYDQVNKTQALVEQVAREEIGTGELTNHIHALQTELEKVELKTTEEQVNKEKRIK